MMTKGLVLREVSLLRGDKRSACAEIWGSECVTPAPFFLLREGQAQVYENQPWPESSRLYSCQAIRRIECRIFMDETLRVSAVQAMNRSGAPGERCGLSVRDQTSVGVRR